MTDKEPGDYWSRDLAENSGGTAITNPATEPPATAPTPEPAQAKNRKPLLIGAAAALVLALGAGGYAIYTNATKPTPIEAAAEKCQTVAQPEDDGHTLTIRRASAKEDAGPDDLIDMACVMGVLKTPNRVMDHMSQTRALDGTQTDSWEDLTARWTYHPDNGMTATFSDDTN